MLNLAVVTVVVVVEQFPFGVIRQWRRLIDIICTSSSLNIYYLANTNHCSYIQALQRGGERIMVAKKKTTSLCRSSGCTVKRGS